MNCEEIQLKYLDEDGYPTQQALDKITAWPQEDAVGCFKFIECLWYYHTWGWRMEIIPHPYREGKKAIEYKLSTAGWSGNEAIARALEANTWLWHFTWVQSRRGGHYIFNVDINHE